MCTIMFVTFVLFATLGITFAGYAGSSSNDVGGGNSYGYGYSGSFSGTGDNVPNVPIPNIPPFPDFDFTSLLNGYFDSFKKYHEHFINTLQQQAQYAQQQAQYGAGTGSYAPGYSSYVPPAAGNGGQGSDYTATRGGFSAPNGGAVASAAIGPKGGYQSAAVYPENPNSPNIFSRFGETSQPGEGGGSYSVFTSSVSSSSNLDGKPQNFHQASTTINDNGKVSTYTVKNP